MKFWYNCVIISLVALCSGYTVGKSCYGDFTRLSPTGRSHGGVKASEEMAEKDKDEILKRNSSYTATGLHTCLDPALIAAIASRESRAGRLLYSTNGWGDYRGGKYHAYGILQCDVYTSGLNCTKYHWDSQEHMEMVTSHVLIGKIKCVQKNFPTWKPEQQLQGGVAAYNFGCKNVQSWKNLDKGTTGGDYSNDVMARAEWIKANM